MAVCVWISISVGFIVSQAHSDSSIPPREREAETAGSAAEDGVSSVDSESWAALEGRWLLVGTSCVQVAPGLDNTVSLILRNRYF